MAECIKVAVRVRPFTPLEIELKSDCVVSMDGASTTLAADGKNSQKTYTYDFSYWSFSDPSDPNFADQERLMDDVGNEILASAFLGYNGSLFAYGQTGSGKTYSVLGTDDSPGIIPRCVDRLFAKREELEKNPEKEIRVWVSYLEIYNEHLKDLLKPEAVANSGEDKKTVELTVIDHPKLGVYVPGLLEEPCRTPKEVTARLNYGANQRAVAATRMNAQSSRSHTVFCIRMEQLDGPVPPQGAKDDRQALNAKINLIDLAGSERLAKTKAEGAQMREGCAINKSLSALGQIIKELAEAHAKFLAFMGRPRTPQRAFAPRS